MYKAESVVENGTHEIHWDVEIQTDHPIQTRRLDIISINEKKIITFHTVDFALPADHRVKESEQLYKYLDHVRELKSREVFLHRGKENMHSEIVICLLTQVVQFDLHTKSRAVGVMSEVDLLLTDVHSELSLLLFLLLPCLSDTASFILLQYQKSRGTSHYTTNMKVTVIVIIVGALRTVQKKLKKIDQLQIRRRIETVQTSALQKSARRLRIVIET